VKKPIGPFFVAVIVAASVMVGIGAAMFLPGCQLPGAYIGEVAGCNAAYDACFDAAAALKAPQPEKAAAFAACRSQVDMQCLPLLVPPAPSAAPVASAAPSVAPSAAPAPSASPSASGAGGSK